MLYAEEEIGLIDSVSLLSIGRDSGLSTRLGGSISRLPRELVRWQPCQLQEHENGRVGTDCSIGAARNDFNRLRRLRRCYRRRRQCCVQADVLVDEKVINVRCCYRLTGRRTRFRRVAMSSLELVQIAITVAFGGIWMFAGRIFISDS